MHCSGRPSPELVEVTRLLHAKDNRYALLTRKQHHFKVKFSDLKFKEKSFLQRYINYIINFLL